jgi:broad specificity phosphatase PhoE
MSAEMKASTPLVERDYDKVIFLIRHADAGGDQSEDAPLTQWGHSEADGLGAHLRYYYPNIDHVYFSSFRRARETAEYIPSPIQSESALLVEHSAPTEDSWSDIKNRVRSAIEEVAGNPDERVAAVVSHGRFIRSFVLSLFRGEELTPKDVKDFLFGMSHAGITVVGHLRGSAIDKGWVLLRWNDNGSLPTVDDDSDVPS